MAKRRFSPTDRMVRAFHLFYRPPYRIRSFFTWLFLVLPFLSASCVHHIHVNPLPSSSASASVPKSLRIMVDQLALEGPDHRPGITLLQWPRHDLYRAVVQYARQRGTFASVVDDHADLTLGMTTRLKLVSRQGRYHYYIRIQAEISEGSRPLKTYLAEGSAKGSIARWITASDRDPIESALQLALDSLFSQIETDRAAFFVVSSAHHLLKLQISPSSARTDQAPFAGAVCAGTYSGQSRRRA